MDNLTLGSMIGTSTFLQLSNTADVLFLNCILHLNIRWRQLELHFDMVLNKSKPEQHKIILPLKFITADSFIVNRFQPGGSSYSVIFEMSIAPQVWKKSETVDEDLQDRLYWSEQEQWIRQCDIIQNVLEPSLALMDTRIIMKNLVLPTGITPLSVFKSANISLGRWKAYCLHLNARMPKDETEVTELLEILKGFNIKVTQRPLTITSDLGDALGNDIDAELLGLPYNVRYSFDVCLAHGYLYVPGVQFVLTLV